MQIPFARDQYGTKCPVYQPAKAGVVEKGAWCTPWDTRNGDRSHTAFPIVNILSNAAAGTVRISQRHWRCDARSLTASLSLGMHPQYQDIQLFSELSKNLIQYAGHKIYWLRGKVGCQIVTAFLVCYLFFTPRSV